MAQNPHLIQIRELKDTISQLNETISLLNKSLQESQKREALMQEQIEYLTKSFLVNQARKKCLIQISYAFLMKLKMKLILMPETPMKS